MPLNADASTDLGGDRGIREIRRVKEKKTGNVYFQKRQLCVVY